ncbi:hypothetical protein QQ045_021372 [Rhodiola kirilowii]
MARWRWKNINASTYAWIPDKKRIRRILPMSVVPANTKVSDFILPNRNIWNSNYVRYIFCPADADAILSIPLSYQCQPDSLLWWPNREGTFTVRSSYWFSTCETITNWENRLDSPNMDIWKRYMVNEEPCKVKRFHLESMLESVTYKR